MTPSGELSSAPSRSLSIPLPASSPSEAAETPRGAGLGMFFLIAVAGLAFLLASFPARNSDVWLHLARGRLVASGQAPSTAAPDLAFDLWGNQTWLYDLFCFGCYTMMGGAGLVIVKALLAAGIALLVLRQSRSTPGWGVPALCTSLAVLTLSKYLSLQPATASYFFFALALALLRAPKTKEGEAPPWLSWPVLLVFLAWANVDRWFLLGLGVVALVWVGEILDAAFASGSSPKQRQALLLRRGVSLVALAAVCFVNPSHINAFVLADELRGLGLSAGQVISPFESAYFSALGWNPASLAYFLLLGLSLVSFLAALPQWRWRRFLPWLALAVLSAYQTRVIPFFALAAGPVLAWNIRDIFALHFQRVRQDAERAGLIWLGRALSLLLILVLLVCAWPGWLQSPPYGMRRWAFDLPPSLEHVAQTVRRWHEEGKLTPNSGGLHLSAESVYAFSWFCPMEKRLRFTQQESSAEWLRRMRDEGVDHVVVHDNNRERLSIVLTGILADSRHWPLLDLEGDVAIFGWRDPKRPGSANLFQGGELDLNRLAFHPPEDKTAPAEASAPPDQSWWQALWQPVPLRSIDRDEALLHLLHAEAIQREAPLRNMIRWQSSEAAALAAAVNTWTFPNVCCAAPFHLMLFVPAEPESDSKPRRFLPWERMVMEVWKQDAFQRDDAPPALFYLAVRAARRAVAADSEDAAAYLLLGEGYLGLLEATRERVWSARLSKLEKLRQAQASAALNRAIALRPNSLQAHYHLVRLYQKMGCLDLILKHLQIYHRLAREAGPSPGVDRSTFLERQEQVGKSIERLLQEVQKRESAVELRAADSPPRDHALAALQAGLTGKALDILLASDISAFGNEGMKLELELLLTVGRARDVQKWLSPEHQGAIHPLEYHWFRVRASAALGDYTQAEDECDEVVRAVALMPGSPEPMRVRENAAMMIGKFVMDGSTPPSTSFSFTAARVMQELFHEQIQTAVHTLRQQADLTALHGLLALEEGQPGEAELAFRAALSLPKVQPAKEVGSTWDFGGRILAQDCLRLLK